MPPIGDLLAQISGQPSPTQPSYSSSSTPKRKADDQPRKPLEKVQRTQVPATALSRPVTQSNRPTTVDAPMSRMKLGQSAQKQPLSRPSTSTTSFKNGQPTPPPNNDGPKAPPKKGSYAEIMARGKAQQATLGQVGKIQHKRIEKQPSKREREDMKLQKSSKLQKNLAPDSKFSKMGQNPILNGQKNVKSSGKVRPEPVPEKKVKKAALATTGYTGTSRPKPGGSASKSSSSSASLRYNRGSDRDRSRGDRYGARYAYPSEEEEEEEEEEEDEPEYESDLSDMEAAAFEVDDEEEQAARIARREDAQALAEENRLKREKEEKRKRLAAMAKSRR
ncbi:hypothetical protein WAI453_008804 [Rhynchosporium graminicola]|uniref:SPT2 chromatin protein n=1 Tax=Rhynchosporium graminicola TaxID=2792576 RepID=A0A1E1KI81_9HELO|nr:uncharacterized protein RCO7_00078 [Rhynchosporium commune]